MRHYHGNVWFTSDTHWHHKNIINTCRRPYADVEEMNEALVRNWNKHVKPFDVIYHLGDVSFAPPKHTNTILESLNGVIHLIKGNHDYSKNLAKIDRFESVEKYAEISVCDQLIILSHFPFLVWNKNYLGSWHLHGHSHCNINHMNVGIRRVDVGVDVWGMRPVSFEELKPMMEAADHKAVDHHVEGGN